MKATIVFLSLIGAALGQSVIVPTYSSTRVQNLARAIAGAEGYGVKGALPTRKKNPGDLKKDGVYRIFRTEQDGFAALQAQLVRIIEGRSKAYNLDMTITRMGARYAGAAVWSRNVAKALQVPTGTKLRDYLCAGDVDIPPVLALAQ